jgi:hypothetical protein
MKSVADGRSLDISVSLNDYYYFYRKAVFIAKKQPYKYIYRLWSLNMRQCFGKGQNVLSSLYDFTRYLICDTVLALSFYIGFRTHYDEIREIFKQEEGRITETVRAYLVA